MPFSAGCRLRLGQTDVHHVMLLAGDCHAVETTANKLLALRADQHRDEQRQHQLLAIGNPLFWPMDSKPMKAMPFYRVGRAWTSLNQSNRLQPCQSW